MINAHSWNGKGLGEAFKPHGMRENAPKDEPELDVGICPVNNYGRRIRLQEKESVPQILSAQVGNNPDLMLTEISTEVILKRRIYSSYKAMLTR